MQTSGDWFVDFNDFIYFEILEINTGCLCNFEKPMLFIFKLLNAMQLEIFNVCWIDNNVQGRTGPGGWVAFATRANLFWVNPGQIVYSSGHYIWSICSNLKIRKWAKKPSKCKKICSKNAQKLYNVNKNCKNFSPRPHNIGYRRLNSEKQEIPKS